MHRSLLAFLSLPLLLGGGCGGDEATQPARSSAPAPAPEIVHFSRKVGVDPIVDEILVGADGRVTVRRLRGAAGARFDHFRLRPRELARLRDDLQRLERRRFRAREIDLGKWYFTLRIGSREPLYFVGGRVPRVARPAIARLNDLIDASSRRDPTYEPR